MGDQRRFRHPSDHATSLADTMDDPLAFAERQLDQAIALKDRPATEQWSCVVMVLRLRAQH
jgi:hypothetical protein